MSQSKMYITFDLDPIVKLACMALDCAHNLAHNNLNIGACCELKYVDISKAHQCSMYEPDGEIEKDREP